MTTIVRDKNSGEHLLLLGAGYGAYQSSQPGVIGHNLVQGEITRVLVTNAAGKTLWLESTDIEIISVDGVSPARALQPQDRQEHQ